MLARVESFRGNADLGHPNVTRGVGIQRSLEDLKPEMATDICERGIYLTGGGAMLDRLDEELERQVGVKFFVPDNPTHCVIKGTAAVLEALPERDHLLIKP